MGISSQREITNVVTQAIADGKLTGNEVLKAKVKLELPDLAYELEIEGEISLD